MILKAITLFFIMLGQLYAQDNVLLMVSPGNNSFFEIRDSSRPLRFVINRPNPRLRYKLEIILNGRQVVNHFIKKDKFKIEVGRYDQEVLWRVEAYDDKDNLVIRNNYATVKIYHNQKPRVIPLKVDRHSMKDKLILSWEEQEECTEYNIFQNGKHISTTARKGAILKEHVEASVLKVSCAEDKTHFGTVELKARKILTHGYMYEFQTSALWFKQELSGQNLAVKSSNQNYLLHVHGLGYQLHWDKRKRNDLLAFVRYGLPLSMGNEVQLLSFEGRLRFDMWKAIREKMLLEFETIKIKYEFNDDFTSEQSMTFLAAGVETYMRFNNKILKTAFLFKKELQSPSATPSFKLRFNLPHSPKLSWIAEIDYNRFKSDLVAGELGGETENHLNQIKAGLTYLF